MSHELDRYYAALPEPARTRMQALREFILAHDPHVTEAWKYRMPFFCYRGKMFCYVWTDAASGHPYLGLVEGQRLFHPQLVQGDRARMKVLPLDPIRRLPADLIRALLSDAIALYTSGQVPLPKRRS